MVAFGADNSPREASSLIGAIRWVSSAANSSPPPYTHSFTGNLTNCLHIPQFRL